MNGAITIHYDCISIISRSLIVQIQFFFNIRTAATFISYDMKLYWSGGGIKSSNRFEAKRFPARINVRSVN